MLIALPVSARTVTTRTAIQWNSDEGVLVLAEAGIVLGDSEQSKDSYTKLAVGAWDYTGNYEDGGALDSAGNPRLRSGNQGGYLLGEKMVLQEGADGSQGLSVFGRVGSANPMLNGFAYYTGIGAVYTGLFPARDEDQLGVGAAAVHAGSDYRSAFESVVGKKGDRAETSLELVYSIAATPWLNIKVDLQYIMNPSADPTLDDAVFLANRWTLTL